VQPRERSKTTQIFTVNAFSNSPTGGNPAGVVLGAELLSDADMQQLAKELGHSETAFVLPCETANVQVRFFTPLAEVDLCGHATVATFFLLAEIRKLKPGRYTQLTRAGLLSVEVQKSGFIYMTQTRPLFGDFVESSVIADSLGIGLDLMHPVLRPQIVSTGLPDIIVPLRRLETLQKLRPDFEKISRLSSDLKVTGYHVFSMETLFGSTAHCRNFAPLYGINEESATGTANGALTCYLFNHHMLTAEEALDVRFEQGYCIGRPSQILVSVETSGKHIIRVKVGGTACRV
jgi:PhzF family phenazine biosynthesis protein